jgi:hypothetical protein
MSKLKHLSKKTNTLSTNNSPGMDIPIINNIEEESKFDSSSFFKKLNKNQLKQLSTIEEEIQPIMNESITTTVDLFNKKKVKKIIKKSNADILIEP